MLSNMLSKRVQYFIRSILQNSKLNREKFVNNKKKYNMRNVKNRNHNMIIKRNFGSSTGFISPNFNKPNKDPNRFTSAIIAIIVGVYLTTKNK